MSEFPSPLGEMGLSISGSKNAYANSKAAQVSVPSRGNGVID